jgi:probable HAF family extracellular repeat protein
MEVLPGLGGNRTYAYGLNNWGMVVGSSQTKSGETHGFLFDGISITDLGTLGGNTSIAKDISDMSAITGYSATAAGATHAFIYRAGGGQMEDIGTLGGVNSYGNAINRYGQVVGASELASGDRQAFFYDGEEMRGLGTLGGSESSATGINDMGFVVGYSQTAEGKEHAFVYHDQAFWYSGATLIDLNDFIPEDSGWESLSAAYDINEWGQIVGVGTIGGEVHSFMLNPVEVGLSQVPLPGTFLLFGSCITLFGMLKRRNG